MVVALLGTVAPAHTQVLDQYFQGGVPGYADALGVTVTTRQRPDYDFPPYHVGNVEIQPQIAEALGYNDNLYGQSHGVGSFFNNTQASVRADSLYSRGGVAVSAAATDIRYFSQPSQNTTDGEVSLGGSYDIGRDVASMAYSFGVRHENPGDLAAGGFSKPFAITSNRIVGNYAISLNRLSLAPGLQFTTFRFDNTILNNAPVIETYRNRDVVEGSMVARYEIAPLESVVVVGRVSSTHYVTPIANFLAPDNKGYSLLAGIDFTPSSVWSYRALIGYEIRSYDSSQVADHNSPIAEASAIFSPTGLTTFTGTFSRTIEDAAQADTVGYTYTKARLRADHEFYRNILLNGVAGYQRADYLSTGGSQNIYDVGGGVTYLVNRYARVKASYDFSTSTATPSGHYNRNIALVQLELGRFDQ